MATKANIINLLQPITPKEHIRQLIEWMSQGVYEKEQIIAVALLCAIAGENMFLLGPPGTAKTMVSHRLKMVFKDGKSFDYLMSRFSTPDEIFGPISISRLKNDDTYERLTTGYLPEADIVFLDEIWKAGPSIQNTLLTVINEHIFHNGCKIMRTPMKVLIAASNELPAKDEGLEALWDRFLMRMVSNCIKSDAAFFKMLKSEEIEPTPLAEDLFITEDTHELWQKESRRIGVSNAVVNAIKTVRKSFAKLEKEDGNQLRYYVSDRRWRKAYRLMQTSAYLNGRKEITLTDFLLLIHSFWNEVECIPNTLSVIISGISAPTIKTLNKIDTAIRQLMTPKKSKSISSNDPKLLSVENNNFAEYDYFYYLVENFNGGEAYFSKLDYSTLNTEPHECVMYFDVKRNKTIIHTLISGRAFDFKSHNATNLKKITVQKLTLGAIIDGTPYLFRQKPNSSKATSVDNIQNLPILQRISALQELFQTCVEEWNILVKDNWVNCDNLFLSQNDLALVDKMIKEVEEQIKTTEVKLNNISLMIK